MSVSIIDYNVVLCLLQGAPSGESSTERFSVISNVKIKLCKVFLFLCGSLCASDHLVGSFALLFLTKPVFL